MNFKLIKKLPEVKSIIEYKDNYIYSDYLGLHCILKSNYEEVFSIINFFEAEFLKVYDEKYLIAKDTSLCNIKIFDLEQRKEIVSISNETDKEIDGRLRSFNITDNVLTILLNKGLESLPSLPNDDEEDTQAPIITSEIRRYSLPDGKLINKKIVDHDLSDLTYITPLKKYMCVDLASKIYSYDLDLNETLMDINYLNMEGIQYVQDQDIILIFTIFGLRILDTNLIEINKVDLIEDIPAPSNDFFSKLKFRQPELFPDNQTLLKEYLYGLHFLNKDTLLVVIGNTFASGFKFGLYEFKSGKPLLVNSTNNGSIHFFNKLNDKQIALGMNGSMHIMEIDK